MFLVRTGLLIGANAVALRIPLLSAQADSLPSFERWETVRAQFPLTHDRIHMAGFLLASHPTPVREAIETHRHKLDENPAEYLRDHGERLEGKVLQAAAEYLGGRPTEIALTDSTTMGLGLLYGGIALRTGQEVLTTTHDHYSTAVSLQLRAVRTGGTVRQVSLYQQPATASPEEIVDTLVKAVQPQTRIVAVTWVHSSTGIKLPIRRMADALATVNARRDEADRVLLCVDGVHGFGVENVSMADLGCDFFIAGCHKWIFGPRGTGLVWGKPEAWPLATAIIPSFAAEAYQAWMQGLPPSGVSMSTLMTPGGFHSFEHRWALGAAFQFHQAIGKARIADRIHALNRHTKKGLAEMRHVTLHTPLSDELSAGLVCFTVAGMSPAQVVAHLLTRGIIASVTPYATRYARLAPSLLTSPEEVDKTLRAIGELASVAT
jgi:selenocysteine lyase/cysteine desulfurase